ncbi:rhamnogalacturonan acetylesterase [Evansella sp. AB-P1]|uniref:rhamnogalacturonan acetylesterase n=1 Tax=Evansella sp. AB-P1 TaxID=3037653 RepID=UPI00241E3C97|nr:rhamnogalacturonan acetylesterase [Evansella sp. AB-P1]MDG5787868.1 rhamnogalacturonan acetylesterase [Evansella sp. AB-P1]
MANVNIFLVGDSTLSNYDASRAPRAGWGQVLDQYLTKDAKVYNEAASGRSSKSFINEGRLAPVKAHIKEGDFLLIQFGHNDEKDDLERHTDPYSTYKEYLKEYIQVAENSGALPILITPVQRRSFDEKGVFQETHGEYPIAMKELAEECNIPLIDLGEKSRILYEELGAEKTKKLFLWFKPGEELNYPNGEEDNTHFSEYGAHHIVKLVLQEIKSMNLRLAKYINE